MSIIHDGCSDLIMLDRLRQYLKELADAEREASRLVREHGSKASQVIAADIEVARKQGDATTVRRLKRVASATAAIEESPAALLHHKNLTQNRHVPLRACVENPQYRFKHTTRRSRFAPRTSIANILLQKMIPDAFPSFGERYGRW
jgi:uncharacterized membrane protein YccC